MNIVHATKTVDQASLK